ncbi:CCR4-NOT transcription complex subunit 7 isoform X2 [Sitodiplosis mosellana]|nr:CCR4-NOT transcription complex subunit 7 isoform X2 [Sitodiplosis mosellana]
MPSAIGGSVPVGVGNNASGTIGGTGSSGGTTHSTSANASGQIPNNEECGIRDVWRHNLEEEFRTIRQIVQKYNYVAMDTEFPGVVARPIGEFRSAADYQYQLLKCNVDLLRIIQLGLTFMDDEAKTPSGYSTWQFNFKFNIQEDMYAQDSIDLLRNSGIQFNKHEEEGIDPMDFAELLMTSGIVLMDNIKWLSFHSGYDFGYLLKLLTDQNLPAEEGEFFELLRLYFPTIYDVKYLMKSCKNLKGGLQEVADQLELRRVGPQHQAGSDSHLTGMAFFKMREVYDCVEFRLAIKNSEKKLFWRCCDDYTSVKIENGSGSDTITDNGNGNGINGKLISIRDDNDSDDTESKLDINHNAIAADEANDKVMLFN